MWMAILGRQPELSLAELEARFGADSVRPLGKEAALVEAEAMNIDQLGGQMKLAKVLGELPATKLSALPQQLTEWLPPADNKQNIGLSIHGGPDTREVGRLALQTKTLAKRAGHKVRVVPNQTPTLSTAQVLHNQLTQGNHREFIIVSDGGNMIVAQSVGVQDIDAYRQRDTERPERDARVGMLPPKLAQIMLNLARVEPGQTVLDPFCGTGVILQEALLLGAAAYGSDIAERMVRMSEANLVQLARQYPQLKLNEQLHLEVADARNRRWQPPIHAVVSEIYLGPAYGAKPEASELVRAAKEIDGLLADTLKNLAPQIESGVPLVLAVPRWQGSDVRLTSLDRLEEFGYTSTRFVHAPGDLVYARDDQIVGRQLLVLSKI